MFMILSDQVQGIVESCIARTLQCLPFSLQWCAITRRDSVSTPRKFYDDVISCISLSHHAT